MNNYKFEIKREYPSNDGTDNTLFEACFSVDNSEYYKIVFALTYEALNEHGYFNVKNDKEREVKIHDICRAKILNLYNDEFLRDLQNKQLPTIQISSYEIDGLVNNLNNI